MKMSFKWQDKHMELFLDTYQQYECLWNNKCINYSKTNVREKAYASMLGDLNIPGLTVADVKAKIKTVRTRYGAELAKVRSSERSGNVGDEIYKPRLFWYKDADKFLRNVCTSKPSLLITKQKEEQETETSFIKASCSVENHEENDSDSPENSRNSPVASSSRNSCANFRYSKNVLKRSLHNPIEGPVKRCKQAPEEENNQCPNEFDYFCESLAIQLKRMPLQRALICQEKLQNVMTQERLFQLSEPHLSSLANSSTYPHYQESFSASMISSTEPRSNSNREFDQYEPNEEDTIEITMKSEIEEEV